MPIKPSDTNSEITKSSRADKYWLGRVSNHYSLLRNTSAINIPRNTNLAPDVVSKFKLSGIGFGNWVNIDDRINYTDALYAAFADLSKILHFGNNVGMDNCLGVTFGARGSNSASAHFEPNTDTINLTRYSDEDKSENGHKYAFVTGGGAGALAHEYGHFLDYNFGGKVFLNPKYRSLTGGRSVTRKRLHSSNDVPIRVYTDDLLDAIMFKEDGTYTDFYKNLRKEAPSSYWYRRNEMFARCFEQYIREICKTKGIDNFFLTAGVYKSDAYITDQTHLKKCLKIMDKIIKEMRKVLR